MKHVNVWVKTPGPQGWIAVSDRGSIWSGNTMAEERDSTGTTVKKRFFAEGEQRIGGKDEGLYYYSRDHLGSIREVTNENGDPVAQYDYDAWGNRVTLTGNPNFDFGYTGHYFHQPSGMGLAMYRAYSPTLGRWISRDPIGENGGLNLYEYTFNDPANLSDPLGLYINIQGDLAYRIRVRQDLQRIFNADPRLRAMLEQLFQSENFHMIRCPTSSDNHNESKPRNLDQSTNGMGTGSWVEYDPDNWFSPSGELRDPAIALTHELRHSQQYDIGVAMFSENPNSRILRLEEWGVRRENIMRDVLGYPWRTMYNGLPVQNPGPR